MLHINHEKLNLKKIFGFFSLLHIVIPKGQTLISPTYRRIFVEFESDFKIERNSSVKTLMACTAACSKAALKKPKLYKGFR